MKSIGKRVTLKRRWTAQGVGKGFTIYFKDSRFKLSSRMLAHEAISAIVLIYTNLGFATMLGGQR